LAKGDVFVFGLTGEYGDTAGFEERRLSDAILMGTSMGRRGEPAVTLARRGGVTPRAARSKGSMFKMLRCPSGEGFGKGFGGGKGDWLGACTDRLEELAVSGLTRAAGG
jgi:hypothetical protein